MDLTLILWLALAGLLATSIIKRTRRRSCSISKRPLTSELLLWLGCGLTSSLALAFTMSLSLFWLPALMIVSMLAASLLVGQSVRLLWHLGL